MAVKKIGEKEQGWSEAAGQGAEPGRELTTKAQPGSGKKGTGNKRTIRLVVIVLAVIVVLAGLVGACSVAGSQQQQVAHQNQAQVPVSAEGVSGENYKDVNRQFEKAGFTQIELEPEGDLIAGWLHDEGDVDEVSVDGSTSFDKGDWADSDAPVIIRYHSYPEKSASSSESSAESSSEQASSEEASESEGESTKESSGKSSGKSSKKSGSSKKTAKKTAKKAAKKVPTEYLNALYTAQSYSDNMYMSKKGIYDQLTSSYGEGFGKKAATYAVNHVDANWNKNALETAKNYRDSMHMSKSAIRQQLVSEYGEQFTSSQADYAIKHLGK